MITFGQIYVRSHFQEKPCIGIRLLLALIQADIDRTVVVKVIVSEPVEIHSIAFLGECPAFLPSDNVIVPESLAGKFDGTFPTDFEDYSLVVPRDTGVHGSHIIIRIGIRRFHVDIRHVYPVPYLLDGIVEIRLGKCAEFRLCLGKIEINLSRPENREVDI